MMKNLILFLLVDSGIFALDSLLGRAWLYIQLPMLMVVEGDDL
jgi:hypothetical protein